MGLKPTHIENQKHAAESTLSAREAQLRAKGLDDRAVARDPLIKKAKAAIRQAIARQARVTALDKQNAELAQAKAGGGKVEASPKNEPKKKKKKKEGGGDKKPEKEQQA